MADMTFTRKFADGSIDYSNPHAPGFRFCDTDDANVRAAHDAYEQRRAAMHYANKRRQQAEKDNKTEDETKTAKTEVSADLARKLADKAWAERTERMSQAWRSNR